MALDKDELATLKTAAERICSGGNGSERVIYVRSDQLKELGGELPEGIVASAPKVELVRDPKSGKTTKQRKVTTAPVMAGELLELCKKYKKATDAPTPAPSPSPAG